MSALKTSGGGGYVHLAKNMGWGVVLCPYKNDGGGGG